MGHSFSMQSWPSSSMICALISRTFSCVRSRQSFLPSKIASRASLTQPGHSESVCRGQPSVGLDFSHDFSSGLSDHLGVKFGLGLDLLRILIVSKVTPAGLQRTYAIAFHARVPQELAIFAGRHICDSKTWHSKPNGSPQLMKTAPDARLAYQARPLGV